MAPTSATRPRLLAEYAQPVRSVEVDELAGREVRREPRLHVVLDRLPARGRDRRELSQQMRGHSAPLRLAIPKDPSEPADPLAVRVAVGRLVRARARRWDRS